MTGFGDAILRARIERLANRVAGLDALASVRIDPAPASPVIVRAVPERGLRELRELVGELVAQTPPDEVLRHHRGPFIERWHVRLAGAPSSEAMYVHRHVGRDIPPAHNHPWSSASLLLAGEIVERFTWWGRERSVPALTDLSHEPESTFERRWCCGRASLRPGDVVWRSAACTHLVTPSEESCAPVTVFATGRRSGAWGFLGADRPGEFGRPAPGEASDDGGACAGRPEAAP